ncbi:MULTISPECIES: ion transporter [unclassified Arsukibacterium]|uniref:ion transporter n=1 Tax=unclassified Arsukibacterium TaxID=2635278 RepID=UPI000C5E2116|nr:MULTISPECIES: ion transporter [unclassified Arsukibacterium]MAA95919.1 ion transporter [Rheinheimera sp.]MBM34777.1 ion transporter [Rheinheimera sp.]HAW91639.1 ion transporter [Candidatus Azambacteria bacterium]|tara:strand:- start:235 stop:1071 length:837 start_codon:yes stop_codon:yes gene_type:complete
MSNNALPAISPFRHKVGHFLQRTSVQRTLLTLILINALILGLETSAAIMQAVGPALLLFDKIILAVFVLEIGSRIYVHRLAFFKDGWSIFDFIVVGIALVPASGPFAVLRALRVLRVLRVLTFVPSMRKIVGALIKSLNGMLSIAMVLGLIYYVAAVMVTKLFGEAFPDWFGSLGASLYTLFQIMTLESWSMGIARPVIAEFPYAWAFFVPFILIATFTMLNLFIAVIVNAVQSMHDEEHKVEHDAEQATQQQLLQQMQQLQQELQQLRSELKKPTAE